MDKHNADNFMLMLLTEAQLSLRDCTMPHVFGIICHQLASTCHGQFAGN